MFTNEIQTTHHDVAVASLRATPVTGFPYGLHITVCLAAVSLSKTSLMPAFVVCTLIVGIVCPNCHGHLVPIMGLTFYAGPPGNPKV